MYATSWQQLLEFYVVNSFCCDLRLLWPALSLLHIQILARQDFIQHLTTFRRVWNLLIAPLRPFFCVVGFAVYDWLWKTTQFCVTCTLPLLALFSTVGLETMDFLKTARLPLLHTKKFVDKAVFEGLGWLIEHGNAPFNFGYNLGTSWVYLFVYLKIRHRPHGRELVGRVTKGNCHDRVKRQRRKIARNKETE